MERNRNLLVNIDFNCLEHRVFFQDEYLMVEWNNILYKLEPSNVYREHWYEYLTPSNYVVIVTDADAHINKYGSWSKNSFVSTINRQF